MMAYGVPALVLALPADPLGLPIPAGRAAQLEAVRVQVLGEISRV
jgi:hypothetical protein